MKKARLIGCAAVLGAVIFTALGASATLPATPQQCGVVVPLSTQLDCAASSGRFFGQAFGTANVEVRVRLVVGIVARTSGYTANGTKITGCAAEDNTPNNGFHNLDTTGCGSAVNHDLTGVANPA